MPRDTCIVCGNKPSHDPSASFHRFPKDPSKRAGWLRAFGIVEGQLRDHSRVCCRHFRDGDSTKEPLVTLGKRFASPIKGKHPRAKRAKAREAAKPITELSGPQSPGVNLSSSVTCMEEGPSKCGESSNTPSLPVQPGDAASPSQSTAVMVSSALLARIECLEAENSFLKASTSKPRSGRCSEAHPLNSTGRGSKSSSGSTVLLAVRFSRHRVATYMYSHKIVLSSLAPRPICVLRTPLPSVW